MKWWVLAGVALAVLAVAFLYLELETGRKEAEWADFVTKWEAAGRSSMGREIEVTP